MRPQRSTAAATQASTWSLLLTSAVCTHALPAVGLDRRRDRLQRLGRAPDQQHVGALGREPAGGRLADATAGARDDDVPVSESLHAHLRRGYPLTAPAISPRMKYRWPNT